MTSRARMNDQLLLKRSKSRKERSLLAPISKNVGRGVNARERAGRRGQLEGRIIPTYETDVQRIAAENRHPRFRR